MKTYTAKFLYMAMLFALPAWVSAQVFNGNLTLSTQAQVDAFNYTEVTGWLTIGYSSETTFSDITNLQPLSKLAKVGSIFTIRNNNQLQYLQGLEKLTTIGRSFRIENNASLTSLQNLENLSSLFSLTISNNDQLQNLQGLEKISSVGDIRIEGNDQLQDLQGLDNLATIIGLLQIVDNVSLTSLQHLENLTSEDPLLWLRIINNDQLQSLQGLENITLIVSVLEIAGNDQLQDLRGLDNLSAIGVGDSDMNENDQNGEIEILEDDPIHGLIITSNEQLKNLRGLEKLTAIDNSTGNLIIENNPSLTSLQGLQNLIRVREKMVSIVNNPNLNDCCAIDELLAKVTGEVHIGGNGSNCNSIEAIQEDCAPNIFDGDLTLSTQAEADAFNYTEVTGSLYISGDETTFSDITNLQALSKLTKVGEGLIISYNGPLQDLQGLDNLTMIGEGLHIRGNSSLTSLQGLENLSSLSSINIRDNDQLKDLQGLENLSSVGSLDIINNVQLQNLQGLENLTAINGTLVIINNTSLTSLQGLENLTTMEGDFNLTNNPKLTSLNALKNVTFTSLREMNIVNNDQLQNLKGLENITLIHNVLEIVENDQLQDLQGLNNLSAIGRKNENDQDGEIGVLDIFEYGLIITDNKQLKSLQGLESLITIDVTFGNLIIRNNVSLASLQGLENLTRVSDEGVSITRNPSLTSLEGLKNLTIIESLGISNNPGLVTLQGLKSLTTIGLVLGISNNSGLVTLQGLESLSSINYLSISDNEQLKNLQGLENLKSLRSIYVANNPNLNDCCAIADLLAKASGQKTIFGNGSNCNSVEAIQESCPPVITGFTLVNAVTDQDISDLELGNAPAVINILETGNQLNIRAYTSPEVVGSVVFALDGTVINKENVAPYALAGDEPPGDYRSWTPILGRHTLTATPYEGKNGKGQAGEPLTVEFVVIDQALAIISFTLVTTDDDQDQYELKDGSTISLQQFDPAKLNIRANTYPDEAGSVMFDLNAVKNFRTENVAPYALGGDIPPGDYKDYTLSAGTYHLTATPYSLPRGKGEAGMPLSITFEVVEDQMTVARTMPVTSPKIKDNAVEEVIGELHAEQIWVYPNPCEGLLHIKLPNTAQAVSFSLYNAQGHQVMETSGGNEGVVLDVSHLTAGMYVLKVASGQNTAMHRILLK